MTEAKRPSACQAATTGSSRVVLPTPAASVSMVSRPPCPSAFTAARCLAVNGTTKRAMAARRVSVDSASDLSSALTRARLRTACSVLICAVLVTPTGPSTMCSQSPVAKPR